MLRQVRDQTGPRLARGSAIGNILTAILVLRATGPRRLAGSQEPERSDRPACVSGLASRGGGPARRCTGADRARDRHSGARSRRAVHAERQGHRDRHQRVRRLRRPHRRERRPGAESGIVLREEVRLPGEAHSERERDMVEAQQRAARGYCDHGGCACRARAAIRCRGARADRLLARRGHGRRRCWRHVRERARGQDARGVAVQRKRVLHSLSRAGSRRAGARACGTWMRSPPRTNWASCSTKTRSSRAMRMRTSSPASRRA